MVQLSKRLSESDLKTNARLKNYPDFSVLQVANVALFKRPEYAGYEKHNNEFWNFSGSVKSDCNDTTTVNESVVFGLPFTDKDPGQPLTEEEKEHWEKVGEEMKLTECLQYLAEQDASGSSDFGGETKKERKPTKDPERAKEESLRRARSAVRDIAYCNRFTMMFTLTFDGKKVNRYDPKAVYKSVRTWFTNMSQRHDLKYVAIPEYHKKKGSEVAPAIHIHGLAIFGDESVLIRSKFKNGKDRVDSAGRPVYNISTWSYGWSTAVPLDDTYTKAVSYVTKYMGKQDNKIFGKWYLSSRQTVNFHKRPEIIALDDMDFDSFRDEAKILSGAQFEQKVFKDVTIISEELWKTPDRMEGS